MPDAIAILLLAGGEARRFPGKLEHRIDGEPMVVRCYRNLRAAGRPTYVLGKGSYSAETDAALDAPLLVDRRPARGPLRALASACAVVAASRVFAVAADQPRLGADVLERLAAAWRPGDEAVVPEHDERIEPLAALYDRIAVLREAFEMRASGRDAMHELVERLVTRFLPVDARHFYNVNEPGEA